MFEAGDETNRLGKNSHKSMLQGKNYEWWEIVEYKRLETTSKSLPMRKQLYTKEISNQVESGIVKEHILAMILVYKYLCIIVNETKTTFIEILKYIVSLALQMHNSRKRKTSHLSTTTKVTKVIRH
jgi:hypothetical protein